MRLLGLVALSCLLGVAGCGDDDGGTDDAGVDSGRDTSTPDTSTPDTSMPDTATPDTGMGDAGDDAAVDRSNCNPFAATSDCEADQKCTVVLDIDPEGAVTDVYFGCVDGSMRVGEGVPCALNVDATPDDDEDDARGDNCDEGLFCTRFGNDPGDSFNRCKPMCDGETSDCGDNGYCLGLNGDPFFGTCNTAEDCDPVMQDCDGDEACYVFGTTGGDVVGDCWPVEPMEGSDGEIGSACEFFNECVAGGSCSGDTCLAFCQGEVNPDGGMPPDAGMSTCGDGLLCQLLEAPEGGMFLTPSPVGICAPPAPEE